MSLSPSTMLALGTKAPDFCLLDVISKKKCSLRELPSSNATVVIFICNHCPYVKHICDKLIEVVKIYQAKGVAFIAINSNDANRYPADAPEKMAELAHTASFSFPYLYDDTQTVAKAYQAACTPDFYLFDQDLRLVYRGRFDGSTPGNNVPVSGSDLIAAMNAVLTKQAVSNEQLPSYGCN